MDMTLTTGDLQAIKAIVNEAIEQSSDSILQATAAGFAEVDAKFSRLDARFDGIDQRFDCLEIRVDRLESSVEQMSRVQMAEVARADGRSRDIQTILKRLQPSA